MLKTWWMVRLLVLILSLMVVLLVVVPQFVFVVVRLWALPTTHWSLLMVWQWTIMVCKVFPTHCLWWTLTISRASPYWRMLQQQPSMVLVLLMVSSSLLPRRVLNLVRFAFHITEICLSALLSRDLTWWMVTNIAALLPMFMAPTASNTASSVMQTLIGRKRFSAMLSAQTTTCLCLEILQDSHSVHL